MQQVVLVAQVQLVELDLQVGQVALEAQERLVLLVELDLLEQLVEPEQLV